jgi:ribonuclease HI
VKPKEIRQPLCIWTDGSSVDNSSIGAWAFVIPEQDGIDKPQYRWAASSNITNNQGELTAIIKAIEFVLLYMINPEYSSLHIYSDSKYCVNGCNEWMHNWATKGWVNRGSLVKNVELWQRLYQLTKLVDVKLIWTRGHADDIHNNHADELCTKAVSTYKANLRG